MIFVIDQTADILTTSWLIRKKIFLLIWSRTGTVVLQYVDIRNHNATYSMGVPYDVEALLFGKDVKWRALL